MTSFRPEIQGLRALAVLSVVFFHLKLQHVQGGFVGVDVFFVISGYLISRNILHDAEAGRFSFGQFYLRRTRRIYPALILTVVSTYIAGALWCGPAMFHDVAKEGTHALLSIANIQYWRESHQYFAANSDELALLHCWSLSLEEQFYLGWPVFLVLARKIGRVREAILVASALSMVGAASMASMDASAAFYLTPFRIFEFGCGALVLFVEQVRIDGRVREVLSLAGILGILFSAVRFRFDMPHVELAMLVPCLAAASIILAGPTGTSRLITHPAFIGIGAISYSLYLCHWPIIFFARFIFGDAAEGAVGTLIELSAMIAVAAVMYFKVERVFILEGPGAAGSGRRTAKALVTIVLALVSVTHLTFVSGGLTWRIPADQQNLAGLEDFPTGQFMAPMTGPAALNLVGDSHASQYEDALSDVLHRLGRGMLILADAGCPILYDVSLKTHFRRKQCETSRDRYLDRIEHNRLPIMFVQFWSFYDDATIELAGNADRAPGILQGKGTYTKLMHALNKTMGRFAAGGRPVLVFGAQVDANCRFNRPRMYQGPLPHAPLPPCPPGSKETAEQNGATMNAMLGGLRSQWPDNVSLLRPVDYFCDRNCPTMKGGVLFYHDATHFTVAGSRYMVGRLEPFLVKFLTSEIARDEGSISSAGTP